MKKVKGLQYAEYAKGERGNPNSYHLFNQVYEINYYLVVGQEKKVINTWPHTEGHTKNDGFCFQNSAGGIVIYMRERGNLDNLAHELIHAISETCRLRGIEHDEDNDEHIAYLMSWLFRGFYFAVK